MSIKLKGCSSCLWILFCFSKIESSEEKYTTSYYVIGTLKKFEEQDRNFPKAT